MEVGEWDRLLHSPVALWDDVTGEILCIFLDAKDNI